MANDDDTVVSASESDDGQLMVGADDLLVLLRRRARDWFQADAYFLERFDHVVESAIGELKEKKGGPGDDLRHHESY
jgi:hypothetical protein